MLDVRRQLNSLTIYADRFVADKPTNLVNKVQYIASPDVLSLLNVRDIETSEHYERAIDKYTLELAQNLVKTPVISASEAAALNEKLLDIYAMLDPVIGGDFKPDLDNEFALYENGNDRPTKAENLSMGMKSFVLLRHMIARGVLQERDVLILDEPENHLHPTLQVVYAHALVLLQKAFNLTLLVTSHSQFFVNALQRFSISENRASVTRFYMSTHDESRPGFCTFKDVTDHPGVIFRSFNMAYDWLSKASKESLHDDVSQ